MGSREEYLPRPIEIVLTREGARSLNKRLLSLPLTNVVSVDTEWYAWDKDMTPVHNGLPFCATLAWWEDDELCSAYVHNHGQSDGNLLELRPFFAGPHSKTSHNVPVDRHVLANAGIRTENHNIDTMVMDHLLDENRENAHGLKECAFDHLGIERKSYNKTFGSPKLKKDGTPSASKQLIVPLLDAYTEGIPCPTDDWGELVIMSLPKRGQLPDASSPAYRWYTLIDYAVADAIDGLLLLDYYAGELRKEAWIENKTMLDFFYAWKCPETDTIWRMERHGMPIDGALLKEKQKVAEADLERYAAEIARWAGCPINVNSPKQLAQFYYGQGSFEIRKTPKAKKVEFVIHGKGWPILSTTETGQPSTGASAIAELARHLEQRKLLDEVDQKGLRSVTNWARSNKQYNTYLVGLHNSIRHGRVHGRLNQIGTTSGRYSASQPNLQNITTGDKDIYDIRDAFMAEEGFCLVVSDFSQLEYRLLAHFTRDPRLIEMFQNGWDMHSLTTWNIFPAIQSDAKRKFGSLTTEALTWISEHFPDERKKAKTLNFEIIYGVGAAKLGEQLNLSEREAQKMIDGWFSGYSRVRPWMDSILQQASSRGFLRTLSGRVQHADMKKLKSNNRSLRGEHERRLINGVIQGSAADMTSRSSLLIDRDPVIVESKSRLIMQVHDELIQHCPIIHRHAVMARTKAIMERPFARELRVPMPVSIKAGPCWSDAK